MKVIPLVTLMRPIVLATQNAMFIDPLDNQEKTFLDYLKRIDPKITAIQYEYGHLPDVRERLISKGKVLEGSRFPMIVVFEDFRTDHSKVGVTGISRLSIILLALSNKNYTRQQREEKTFEPILRPMYELFKQQLKLSGKFMIYDVTTIKHTQVDLPHWGDPKNQRSDAKENTGYLTDQCLDGIGMDGTQLISYFQLC